MTTTTILPHGRVLHGALSRLEPCAMKVASTVLRGRGGGNVALLPDVDIFERRRREAGETDIGKARETAEGIAVGAIAAGAVDGV